jgi:hypothetical protein
VLARLERRAVLSKLEPEALAWLQEAHEVLRQTGCPTPRP